MLRLRNICAQISLTSRLAYYGRRVCFAISSRPACRGSPTNIQRRYKLVHGSDVKMQRFTGVTPVERHHKCSEKIQIVCMTQLTTFSSLGLSVFLSHPVVSLLFQRSFNCVERGITRCRAFVGQSSGAVFKSDMTQRTFNPLVESLWHLTRKKQLNGQIASRGLPLGHWPESCVEHTNCKRINSEH